MPRVHPLTHGPLLRRDSAWRPREDAPPFAPDRYPAEVLRRAATGWQRLYADERDSVVAATLVATDLARLGAPPELLGMASRVIEDEVIPTSQELGVSQIVFSPVAQGVLTGKYVAGQPVPEGSRATDDKGGADFVKRFLRDDVLERVQALRPVADQAGLTMAQLAVAWVLHHPNVASAIIGASRPEQVTENVRAADVSLAPELMALIDEVLGDVVERDANLTLENAPAKRPV